MVLGKVIEKGMGREWDGEGEDEVGGMVEEER